MFDLILYVPSTIFQLYRDGSSWVEPVLSYDKCVLLKDHNAVTPVRLESSTLSSLVKHSAKDKVIRLHRAPTTNESPISGSSLSDPYHVIKGKTIATNIDLVYNQTCRLLQDIHVVSNFFL